jgi:hypothetical protein
MLAVLDQETRIVHISYKYTHFRCMRRLSRKQEGSVTRVKAPPTCLECIAYMAKQ